MEYIEILLKVLGIALVSSVVATKTIDGVKVALGAEDKHLFNRIMAIIIDLVFASWLYFIVAKLTDYYTYGVVCLLTIAGANAIYNILHDLETAKQTFVETETNLHEINENVGGEG